MDRRSFLKQVTLYTAGVLLTPPVFQIIPSLSAASASTPDLMVAKGRDYTEMVNNIISAFGGMQKYVKTGDKVVIKPNIGWDRNVEQAANTHPDVVTAIARLCLDAGASTVKIFDRTCNEERRCYVNSGIKAAVGEMKAKQVRLDYIDERRFVPVAIKNGTALKEWEFYRDALQADTYINVPVAKHHSLSGLSLGLKNVMGVVGGWRGRLHFRLDEKLADLNMVIKPDITIVDASRVIVRNGPQGGRLSDVKRLDTIIGSEDPVAADAYATTLFDMTPDQVKSTVQAYKKGLGQMDLEKCRIHEV